jgi:hypothetical protein
MRKVEKRLLMIGRDNKMELKMNGDYWEQFNTHWRSYIKTAYMINWNWNEFMKKEQVGIQALIVQLDIITKDNWEEMKDRSTEEIFIELDTPRNKVDKKIKNLYLTRREQNRRTINGLILGMDCDTQLKFYFNLNEIPE